MITYHKPVLLEESIEALNINPAGIYIDVTYGGGGHSAEILKQLTTGKLIAFDVDLDAQKNVADNKNLIFVRSNFKYLKRFLEYLEIEKVDGILADLGVSSHHFDDELRGFSYRFDGNLDMRMNQEADFSAEKIINEYSADELYKVFKTYGEVNNSKCVVDNIVAKRKDKRIKTIDELIKVIENCMPKNQEYKYLSKVFQGLRIETNNELETLKQFLQSTDNIVKKDGRLVIISYHSLEDRLVKNYLKAGNFEGTIEKDMYGNIKSAWETSKLIIPNDEEITLNSRARSAKLRVGIRN